VATEPSIGVARVIGAQIEVVAIEADLQVSARACETGVVRAKIAVVVAGGVVGAAVVVDTA
jgi:hypothetical protein